MSAPAHTILLALGLTAVAACGTEGGGEAEASATSEGPADMAAAADGLEPTGLPNPYMTHRNWGLLPRGREWGRVSGVSSDPTGETIWVFERCGGDNCVMSDDPPVMRFAPDGTLLTSFGADMFVRPHGLHVDEEGNVWVTDGRGAREAELEAAPDAANKGNQVVKFSPEGEVLMVLGTPGMAGAPPEALNQPNDVIVAPNGDILVSEGHSYQGPHGRISRFSSDGTFLESFGEFGSGPGQFSVPHAMDFDSQGRLFVADRGNNRIQIFDSEYNFVDEWKQFGRPNDVLIDEDDTMYVLDSESGDQRNPGMRRGVYIGSARDGSVHTFIPPHENDSPYGTIGEGIAIDAAGHIFVGEVSINGITMFMPM
jgi:sugar lactone lactonase YvrE